VPVVCVACADTCWHCYPQKGPRLPIGLSGFAPNRLRLSTVECGPETSENRLRWVEWLDARIAAKRSACLSRSSSWTRAGSAGPVAQPSLSSHPTTRTTTRLATAQRATRRPPKRLHNGPFALVPLPHASSYGCGHGISPLPAVPDSSEAVNGRAMLHRGDDQIRDAAPAQRLGAADWVQIVAADLERPWGGTSHTVGHERPLPWIAPPSRSDRGSLQIEPSTFLSFTPMSRRYG